MPLGKFKKELQEKIQHISKEQQQEILDLMHSGCSVGDVCKQTGLELLIVSGIICENIEHVSILRKQVK